jgi:MerR family transcriptional regulator, copper efflux regulator
VIEMSRRSSAPAFRDYLTIKEAAAFLGVCPGTLRNWDRAGKVCAHRHPVNGYRLYARPALEALLNKITPRPRETRNAR